MEISEQYIKMCEKAEEIQEGHNWNDGDYYHKRRYKDADCPFTDGYVEQTLIYCNACRQEYGCHEDYKRMIWLPTQSQLQEMLEGFGYFALLVQFFEFAKSVVIREGPIDTIPFDSMEQLWLGFVMSKLYGKVWDGEDWKPATRVRY